jgi:hypothetical protein
VSRVLFGWPPPRKSLKSLRDADILKVRFWMPGGTPGSRRYRHAAFDLLRTRVPDLWA